jgi:hypothetical protein
MCFLNLFAADENHKKFNSSRLLKIRYINTYHHRRFKIISEIIVEFWVAESEPEFVKLQGVQESIPRNRFRLFVVLACRATYWRNLFLGIDAWVLYKYGLWSRVQISVFCKC